MDHQAPPKTKTFPPLISPVSFSLFTSTYASNILTGRKVTLSEMSLSRLNIKCFCIVLSFRPSRSHWHAKVSLLHNIRNPVQLILNILQAGNLGFGLFQVESSRVVGVELVDGGALGVALLEELVVVKVAVVGGDAVEVAHILGLGAFFFGEQRFVHLFAVADAYDLDVFFLAAEQLAHRFGLGLDGAGGSLLDEDVAVLAVLEGEEHQVNRLLESHYEAGHLGFGEGDGVALTDLVDPEGDDTAAGAHHVAVTGAADLGVAAHS